MLYRVTFIRYYATAIAADDEDDAIDRAEDRLKEVYGPNWDYDEVECDIL